MADSSALASAGSTDVRPVDGGSRTTAQGRVPAVTRGAARSPGDRDHPRRQPVRARGHRPGARLHRRRGQGGLHRRRPQHQRPRLHPGRRDRRSSSTTRTSAGRGPGRRPAAPRPSSTPAPSPPRDSRPMTSPATASGLSAPCLIRILGVAPGASLVGLNVFGSSNDRLQLGLPRGHQLRRERRPRERAERVLRLEPLPRHGQPRPDQDGRRRRRGGRGHGDRRRAGTPGRPNTIGSPATDPDVISAGATTTYRAYAQTGIGGINLHGVKGWLDNNISGLSSGGFAQDGTTVDVVAPGDLNWALCSAPSGATAPARTSPAGRRRSSSRGARARPPR